MITPYHPIKVNDEWVFPQSVCKTKEMYISEYYNFVLEGGHILRINGIDCISLGHGMADNDVVAHDYLGTSRVIEDLKSMAGWKAGMVVRRCVRDPLSHRIVGI